MGKICVGAGPGDRHSSNGIVSVDRHRMAIGNGHRIDRTHPLSAPGRAGDHGRRVGCQSYLGVTVNCQDGTYRLSCLSGNNISYRKHIGKTIRTGSARC